MSPRPKSADVSHAQKGLLQSFTHRLLRRFACAMLMPPQRELTQRAREDLCWLLLLKGFRLEDVLNHALLSRKLAKRLEHRWHGLTSAMARWPYAHLTRTLRQQLLHMPINNCWFGYGDRQNSLRKKKRSFRSTSWFCWFVISVHSVGSTYWLRCLSQVHTYCWVFSFMDFCSS